VSESRIGYTSTTPILYQRETVGDGRTMINNESDYKKYFK